MASPRIRVFIVDDHPLVRDWLATLLRQQPDFEMCGQAENAADALAAMATRPPDVAVVDLSLQSGSGFDLIKDLLARKPAPRVVVLSMHEEVLYAERALRAGASGYVTKRESTGRIIEAIRAVHTGRIYASPELLGQLAERMVGRGPDRTAGTVETLSDRELDVFRRLGQGQGTRRIAEDLRLSMKTVQAYCARIKDKLGLANVSELMREAVRWIENERRD